MEKMFQSVSIATNYERRDERVFASDLLGDAIYEVTGFDVAYQLGLKKIMLMNQKPYVLLIIQKKTY